MDYNIEGGVINGYKELCVLPLFSVSGGSMLGREALLF